MRWSAGRRIAAATAIAGTLDIGMAIVGTLSRGKSIVAMLGGIASGPFRQAVDWDPVTAAAVGLAVHFAIVAVMAAVFIYIHDRSVPIRRHALAAAALYGLALWLVMYGLVLPWRFGTHFPSKDAVEIAKQLFAHVVLVGLTIGLVAKR